MISYSIPVFNVDSSPNKASEISEVVDILLQYGIHLERMLLTNSGFEKQDLILEYNWLKNHNLKINQGTGKVEMTCYPPRCKGGHALCKEQTRQKKAELYIFDSCRDGPYSLLLEEDMDELPLSSTNDRDQKLKDHLFII